MPDEQKRYRQVCRGNEWDDMVEDPDGDWIRALPGVITLSAEEAVRVMEALSKIAALPIEQFGMSDRAKPLHGWNDYRMTVGDIVRCREAASILTRAQKEG